MRILKFTLDLDRCEPLIQSAVGLSILWLTSGPNSLKFQREQKRLKSAILKALVRVEDMGPVKKKKGKK